MKSGNMEMIKALLAICKIDHLDSEGNSVFHFAAGTTKEIINVSRGLCFNDISDTCILYFGIKEVTQCISRIWFIQKHI